MGLFFMQIHIELLTATPNTLFRRNSSKTHFMNNLLLNPFHCLYFMGSTSDEGLPTGCKEYVSWQSPSLYGESVCLVCQTSDFQWAAKASPHNACFSSSDILYINSTDGLYFILRRIVYLPGSTVRITDIGTPGGTDPHQPGGTLVCVTTNINTQCCRNSDGGNVGDWYIPNGSVVIRGYNAGPIFRTKSTQQVRLSRIPNVTEPVGTYECRVPDSSGVEQVASINIQYANIILTTTLATTTYTSATTETSITQTATTETTTTETATTEISTAETATTEISTTEAATTETSTAETATTEISTTEAATTETSTTEAATTDTSTAKAATTETTTAETATTETSTTEIATTEISTTEAATTKTPTTEAVTTETPTTETVTTKTPTTEAVTTETPTTETVTTKTPTTEAVTTETPTTETVTTKTPTTKAVTTETPTTEFVIILTTEARTIETPSTEVVATQAPTIDSPTETTKTPMGNTIIQLAVL